MLTKIKGVLVSVDASLFRKSGGAAIVPNAAHGLVLFWCLVAFVAIAALSFVAMGHMPSVEGLGLIGMAAAAPAAPAGAAKDSTVVDTLPWRRMKDKPLTVLNCTAGGKATIEIPRYAKTLADIMFVLTGTTFTPSHITTWRLKFGPNNKTISIGTGADLKKMNAYDLPKGVAQNDKFLMLYFTSPKEKSIPWERIGGLDLTKLPEGKLFLELDISSSASAPVLDAFPTWEPPQGNSIVKRYLQYTGISFASAGNRTVVPLDFGKADIMRLFIMYPNGTDWARTATSVADASNTETGAMGAVTVAAGCKVGVHQIVVVEPASNAGTFLHFDPDGLFVGRGQIASAYSAGGLAFTWADGTDAVSGDFVSITVSETTDGNINRVEFKKDGTTIWDRFCNEARIEQKLIGNKSPQSRMFVLDATVENGPAGIIRTGDATQTEVAMWPTNTDNGITVYAEVLQDLDKFPL